MRNFRFDTGFITGFDAGNNRTGNYLLKLLLGNRQLLSNLRACSNECIHKFCRVSLASPCRAEKKYERTLLAGYGHMYVCPFTQADYDVNNEVTRQHFGLAKF